MNSLQQRVSLRIPAAVLTLLLALVFVPGPAAADDGEPVTYTSYRIAAQRPASMGIPPNGTEGTEGCYLVLQADFPGTLTLTDAEAAASSFRLADGTSVGSLMSPYVTKENNTLTFMAYTAFLPGGVIRFQPGLIAGVQCAGRSVTWPASFQTVVPTGLQLIVTDVTPGTADTPASTTVQVARSACMRSMNHILWTSNGTSLLSKGANQDGTSQTKAAHHHNYWSFTTADSAQSIVSTGLRDDGYQVSASGDRVTITAKQPKEGEYLGIYNYDDHFLQENGLTLDDAVTGLPAQTEYDAQASEVMEAINAIGVVTPASGDSIAAARSAYNALPQEKRTLVSNADVLEADEALLAASQQKVQNVIDAIDGIGRVTLRSGEKIKAARSAYDKLSEAEKAAVSNAETLTEAEATLQKLQDAAALKERIRQAQAKKPTLRARARKDSKVRFSWKKVKGVSGYQLVRSTRKHGGFRRVKTVRSAAASAWTGGKLKKGRKYYYKIRPFTKIGSRTYYGKYSRTIAVKVKK